MATYNGVNSTNRDVTVPSVKIPAPQGNARCKYAYDEFSLTAALSTGDLINMMKLPAGAQVIDVILSSADLDSGSASLLDVGYAANGVDSVNTAAFLSAVDNHTGATTKSMTDQANMSGQFQTFSVETQVQIKINTAGNATSGKIKLGVLYSI